MTLYVPSITVDQVIDTLGTYIQLFTTAEVIRASVNRTSMPLSPFIELTEIVSAPLNKPIETYTDTTEIISEHTRIDIQIDMYGWELTDTAKALHASFRTVWAVSQFPTNIVPLYCTDPMKMPIENAEEQYEQRWTMTVSLQYNPDVSVPQDSFNSPGSETFIPVDLFYII